MISFNNSWSDMSNRWSKAIYFHPCGWIVPTSDEWRLWQQGLLRAKDLRHLLEEPRHRTFGEELRIS